MTKIQLVKAAGEIVVSIGVSGIVSNVIKCTTPMTMNKAQKVFIGTGAFVLSSMASDQAVAYTEDKLNKLFTSAKKVILETEKI